MAHARSITLTNEEVLYLQSLTRQRTIQAQVVDRAKMLLYKAQGASNSDIAERLDVNSVCSLSNLFFRFHTTTLTEACSNELKQHHL